MEDLGHATERAIDPFVARAALERLADRAREALAWSVAAAVVSGVLMLAGDLRLGFPPLLGAVVGLMVAAIARSDRQALVARLVRQRSAYEIEEVAAVGYGVVTADARVQAARAIGRLVLEADGFVPSNPIHAVRYERIRACRGDLLAVAFELVRTDTRVHPTSLLLLQKLLTSPTASPLLRMDGSASALRASLRRVVAGIEPDVATDA